MKMTFKEFSEHFRSEGYPFLMSIDLIDENEKSKSFSLETDAEVRSFVEFYGDFQVKDFIIDLLDDNFLDIEMELVPS